MAATSMAHRAATCKTSYNGFTRVCAIPQRTTLTRHSAASSFSGALRTRTVRVEAARGGVLDNPAITTPASDKGTESIRRKSPIYKVMLHNDNYNRREYVVKTLMKIVDTITVDDAVNAMQEAHETGVALVVACAQEKAESYVEGLRLNGLVSTMEPGH